MPKELGKIGGKALGFFGSKALAPNMPSFNPSSNIRTPAFNMTTSGGDVTLNRLNGPQRFAGVLDEIAGVRAEVKPGFGRFTEAAVKSIQDAKNKALGNVRDSLARRRVAGSNFANNALVNIERQFAQDEELARSGALIKEIEVTTQLIDERYKTELGNFELDLKELGIASNVSSTILQVMSQQAAIDKELAAKAIGGTGSFLSDILGTAGEAIGGFLPSFGGGSVSRSAGSISNPILGASQGIQ